MEHSLTPWWWLRGIKKIYHFRMFSRVVPSEPCRSVQGCLAGWGFITAESVFPHVGWSPLLVSLEALHLSLLPHLLNFTKQGDWALTLAFILSGVVSPFVGCRHDFSQIGGQSDPMMQGAQWCCLHKDQGLECVNFMALLLVGTLFCSLAGLSLYCR